MKKLLLFVIACTLGLFGAVSAQETVLIGDEVNATTSTSNPFDIFYDYGISQQLYTADEINHAAGTISGIAIKFKGDESEPNGVYERKVAVYINSTDLETIPYGKAKNVQTGQVANFDGTITYVPENWATFNFTTPFQYDGGNILITMYDYTGKSAGEGFYSFYTNLNDDATDYKVSNKGDLPSNYNAYNIEDYVALGSVFSTTKERNIIQLTFGAAGEGGEEPEPTPEPEVPEQPETNDVVVTIGDASAENTNSSANYPFCNTYTYSHTQQIYSSAVIKSYSNNTILEGNITKIKYYIAEGSQEYFGGVKVYMRNSDLAAFTGATTTEAKQAWDKDFTAEDLVFEGEVDVVDNAIEMTLSKPFAYDGTKNLIIYVDVDTKNGTVATKFRYTKTFADGTAFTDKGLLYYRNQNNNAGLGNWTTASGSPSNYLSVVSLTFAGEGGGEEPTPEPEPTPVAPAAPVVAVDTVTETTVTLTWAAVENATSYNVYVGEATEAVNVKETTYTATGLTAETEYTFVVKAVNEVGESEASNVATAKTLAAAPVGPTVPAAPVVTVTVSYDTIQVRWEPVAGATSYRLYYKGELQDEFEDPALDIQVPTQGKYCFTITAVNEVGESEPAEACADVVAPEGMVAPAAPVLNATLDGDVAVLSWSAVEFGTYYNVYLLTPQSEMPYQYLGTSKDTSVKLQLEDKGEYCFFVTAQNLVGESKESNTACVNYGEGVEENVATFNIYPNPVSDKLVIETEATIEAVTIYSLTGVMVYAEVDFNNNMIDVTDFASGVYFIKVRTENGEAVQRFIKK